MEDEIFPSMTWIIGLLNFTELFFIRDDWKIEMQKYSSAIQQLALQTER